MTDFDPRDLIERTIMDAPVTIHPTPGGYDLRRPGTLVMSLLRKAIHQHQQEQMAAAATEAISEHTEPIDAAVEMMGQIGPATAPPPVEKTSTDQAPRAPKAPGVKRRKKPKAKKRSKKSGPPKAKTPQKIEKKKVEKPKKIEPPKVPKQSLKFEKLKKLELGKLAVDQAPKAPAPPGNIKPKAVKTPKVEGATVTKAYNPNKPFEEPEFKETVASIKEAQQPPPPPARANVKQQDIVLWKAYSSDPSPNNLKPLMTAMQPLIHSEVNRWKAAAPQPALHRQAQSLTLHAIKTYDPNKGAALGTHVMNRLKKLSRTAYQHQDLVRLPENKKLRSQALYNAESELQGELGRDPTNAELADRLGWSPKRVSDVQRSLVGEYVESQDVGGEMFSDVYGRDVSDPVLDYVYYDLDPTDKQIFEHLTGYSGKPVLTMQQVGIRLGLTDSQVRTRKTRIIKKIKEASR
jgi:DNA-directed RNA polymerase specialized sigma subunit